MNKIKVIDLLNKIANGEEVPKKVKVGYYYYEYEENGEYINTENTEDLLFDFDSYYHLEQCLNVEAEVIEEDKKIEKKIEKVDVNHLQQIKKWKRAKVLGNKINEIIDYLEENK